jgi:hypothetical protein
MQVVGLLSNIVRVKVVKSSASSKGDHFNKYNAIKRPLAHFNIDYSSSKYKKIPNWLQLGIAFLSFEKEVNN